RDMDQAIYFVLQSHKGPEARQFADIAGDEIADLVEPVNIGPRILIELLHAYSNALIGLVHLEHDGFDLFAFFQYFGRMIDFARPGNIRDVNHTIQALFKLDKSAIAGEVANLAFDLGAGRIFFLSFIPRVGFELAQTQRDFLFVAI